MHFGIMCAGPGEIGACCDMYVTQCEGGEDDGEPCDENADCAGPGTCESVCREVPKVNCPYPRPGLKLRPGWAGGKFCENDARADGGNSGAPTDPFPHNVCGQSACCFDDGTRLHCQNLTKSECHERRHTNNTS